MKGVLALDIDGTIADKKHNVPDELIEYLKSLYDSGWVIACITGRTFSFSQHSIETFHFPYYLAVQNGADILLMPEKKALYKKYLDTSIISKLDQLYEDLPEDYIIYSGLDMGDYCIYRQKNFSEEGLEYINKLKKLTTHAWMDVSEFSKMHQKTFPLIKCIGSKENMRHIQKHLEDEPIEVALIKDGVDMSQYILLITAQEVNKGSAVKHIQNLVGQDLPVIAAGDDNNDLPMFEKADISIAIESAPQQLLDKANIISSSPEGEGIKQAIEQAIRKLS